MSRKYYLLFFEPADFNRAHLTQFDLMFDVQQQFNENDRYSMFKIHRILPILKPVTPSSHPFLTSKRAGARVLPALLHHRLPVLLLLHQRVQHLEKQ